jgi:hypothetical protein
MSDFAATWNLVRHRYLDAIQGLTQEQLNWRLHPGTLTLGEMALHVAGVEISFGYQLLGETPSGLDARLKAAATDGSVNEKPFPFAVEEITPELVTEALERAHAKVEPLITNPDAYRDRQIVSALGPLIDGTGAFARLAYHPSYHHGQVHFIRTAPGFPA